MNEHAKRPHTAEFLRTWARSHAAVDAVQRHFLCTGFETMRPPVKLAPNRDETEGYGDKLDLTATIRINAKRKDHDFTCAEDYGYPTVFVTEVSADEKAIADDIGLYVITNRNMTHAAFIFATSRASWIREPTTRDGRRYTVVSCPKHLVQFVSLRGI